MRDQAHASGRSAAGVGLPQGEAPIFSPGDRIRTMTRSPVGHCCVPTHLRGKAGVVDMVIEPAGVDNEGEVHGHTRGTNRHNYRIAVPTLKRLPSDIGSLMADPVQRVDHELEPWEKRCHALADALDVRGTINTEEKRRGAEALGAEMAGRLTYYERWIAASARIPFQQGILAPGRTRAQDGRGRGVVRGRCAGDDPRGRAAMKAVRRESSRGMAPVAIAVVVVPPASASE